MPLTAADVVSLEYSGQYSLAGVQQACESLLHGQAQAAAVEPAQLRSAVAAVAFEMALRRWLDDAQVSYQLPAHTLPAAGALRQLGLGGRRCELRPGILTNASGVQSVQADAGWLLGTSALVAPAELAAQRLAEEDIFIFGSVTGSVAHNLRETQRVAAQAQALRLLYIPPRPWQGAGSWRSLGQLVLKSAAKQPLQVELGGLDRAHQELRCTLLLQPMQRTLVPEDFYCLRYLCVPALPDGVLGVHSPALRQTPVITPRQWQNIWFYGLQVHLCGWLNKRDFRSRSVRLAAGTRLRQYVRTEEVQLAIEMGQLRPLARLLELVRAAS